MFKKLTIMLGAMGIILLTSEIVKAEKKVIELEEVVVTATKSPLLLKEIPYSVTIISRDEIESDSQDVGQVLENLTGIRIQRYGAMGAGTSILFRGLNSSKTLVLIDGRPVNSPSTGSADLSWLSIENVERIEVVRGPNSALYGANGIAGVINIITSKVPEEPITEITGSYGQSARSIFNLKNGKTFENFGYLLTTTHKKSKGERGNDAHNDNEINLKLNYQLAHADCFTLSTGFYKDKTEHPGSKPAKDVSKRTLTQRTMGNDEVSSLVDYGKNKRWYLQTAYQKNSFQFKTYLNDWNDDDHRAWICPPVDEHHVGDDNFKTKVKGVELQNSWQLTEKNLITAGMSIEKDEFDADKKDYNQTTKITIPSIVNADRTTKAVYLNDMINLSPDNTINFGVRWDDPSDYNSQVNPKIGLTWLLDLSKSISISYGKSFKAPSLNDLYWPSDPSGQGNPNLKPEKGESYELGISDFFNEKIHLKSTVFHQSVKNMIKWAPTGPLGPFGNKWQPSNLDEILINGLELEASTDLTNALKLDLKWTHLDAEQRSQELINAETNQMQEIRRKAAFVPENKADLGLQYKNFLQIKDLKLNLALQYVSAIYQYYSNWDSWPNVTMDTKKIPGYTVVNARLSKSFRDIKYFLSGENLFNEKYSTIFGSRINDQDYPMPERKIIGGFEIEF